MRVVVEWSGIVLTVPVFRRASKDLTPVLRTGDRGAEHGAVLGGVVA